MERIRTTDLAVVTKMDEEETSDTTGRQTEVSGDKDKDRRTYGAAIEVPEMVLVSVGSAIQAEVTWTPRNQTGKLSGRAAVWCSARRRTIENRTKVGEGSLGIANVNCSCGIYISSMKDGGYGNSAHRRCSQRPRERGIGTKRLRHYYRQLRKKGSVLRFH